MPDMIGEPLMTLYTVRNGSGQWLPKAAATGPWTAPWEPEPQDARIYGDRAPARAMVTRLTGVRPEAGPYQLVELLVTEAAQPDESERVARATTTIEQRQQKRDARQRAWKVARAKQDIAAARQLLRELEGIDNA